MSDRKRGRPWGERNGKARSIYLDEETMTLARAIGDGSVSEGIRRAVRLVAPKAV